MSFDHSILNTTPAHHLDDPTSPTHTTTRTRQWCERVAQANGLDAEQLDDLKQLVNLASGQDDSIVRLFIWLQATQYRILNHILQKYVDLDRFMRVLRDVENHLGTAWEVPRELKVTVKVETRNMLVDYAQPSYSTIHLDVMAYLHLHKDQLGMIDIFGNPSREALLGSYLKKAASNARTALREVLILSVFGKGKKSLEDTTWDIMNRFKKGGAGTNLKPEHQIRIALLRRWTYEELFQVMQPTGCEVNSHIAAENTPPRGLESNAAPSLSELLAADGTAPRSNKRKRDDEDKVLKPTVGKVPKGEDFWSKIDRRMDSSVTAWGNSLKDPQWRVYIDETVSRDRQIFGRCTSGVLPAIPMQVTSLHEPTPSAGPLPSPSTTLASTTDPSNVSCPTGSSSSVASHSADWAAHYQLDSPAVAPGTGTVATAPLSPVTAITLSRASIWD